MNKSKYVIALILSTSLLNMNCKSGDSKLKSNTSSSKVDQNDASDIIDFNNNYLETYRTETQYINDILEYADKAVDKSHGKVVYSMPIVSGMYSFKKNTSKIPNLFGDKQAEMEQNFQIMKDKSAFINDSYVSLKTYINAEDYKDDKGAKADQLTKAINEAADAYTKATETIYKDLKPIAENAENKILINHPMKDYIISAKASLNALDETYDVMEKQYSNKYNDAEVQAKYDALEKSLAANQAVNTKVSDDNKTKLVYYKTFTDNLNTLLGTLRKLMRNSKETGIISDRDANSFSSAYKTVISSYNTFVN